MQLSYNHDDLLRVLLAMSQQTRVNVPGAVRDPKDSTYGVPIVIHPYRHGGVVVTLDTGVEVYLNIRDYG